MINYEKLINKTEDFIEDHLSEKITLDMLAQNLNISKYYYHHIFSANSNETIKEFTTRIKMERSAIYLVVNQSITITDIAFKYGYSDSSSYNKTFKKFFGINPTQYRKARNDK
jgi:AraC family of transcriptional regulator, multidrug resistance transcriptional activator